jgi:hypothetical protein
MARIDVIVNRQMQNLLRINGFSPGSLDLVNALCSKITPPRQHMDFKQSIDSTNGAHLKLNISFWCLSIEIVCVAKKMTGLTGFSGYLSALCP